jgi:glutamyl-tRNA synthetase
MTRFAPTPSGFLHQGNLINALIIQRVARDFNLPILLRIDDMDRTRYRFHYLSAIFEVLQKIDFKWDVGPQNSLDFEKNWTQLLRYESYQKAFDGLQERNMVFPCACSRKDIKARGSTIGYDGYCLKYPPKINDWVCFRLNTNKKPLINNLPSEIFDKVNDNDPFFRVWTVENKPAYQLSSLVDDLYVKSTHIVRGKDLWQSTLNQLLLSVWLPNGKAFREVTFFHHDLIQTPDGQKISKSTNNPKRPLIDLFDLKELRDIAEQLYKSCKPYTLT